MKYELEPFNYGVPDDELLADLRRVAKELGKDGVTVKEYKERGRFNPATLTRRFGSWLVATDKAELSRTRNLVRIPSEKLFANLVELWTNGGRQPRYEDLTPGVSRFSKGTYVKRFGTWRKALEAFVRWANEGELSPVLSEVAMRPSGTTPQNMTRRTPKSISRRTPRNINWRMRALVLMRHGARCRLCGAVPTDGIRLHVDHIKPWSKGGETVLENLQILCNICNIGKSDVEPETNSSLSL